MLMPASRESEKRESCSSALSSPDVCQDGVRWASALLISLPSLFDAHHLLSVPAGVPHLNSVSGAQRIRRDRTHSLDGMRGLFDRRLVAGTARHAPTFGSVPI